jgi:acetyltransferase-like isoleucine patch superfamily enzyme
MVTVTTWQYRVYPELEMGKRGKARGAVTALQDTHGQEGTPAGRPSTSSRTEHLTRFPAPAGENSLWGWRARVPAWRVIRNFLVIFVCRYLPSLRWKIRLYRMIGVKVGAKVSPGLGAMLDIFFPELIHIGDNSILGYNSVILAHEFLVKELRTGPVVIGRDVVIGAHCTILPGVVIGDGAVISAQSLVNSDIPPHVLAGGVPARPLLDAHGTPLSPS